MNIRHFIGTSVACISLALPVMAQVSVSSPEPHTYKSTPVTAPAPQPAGITGTVTDGNGGVIPGAQVVLSAPGAVQPRTVVANGTGGFKFEDLQPGVTYHVTISANGFANWTSPPIVLTPGQYYFLTDSKLTLAGGSTSVTVYASQAQLAVHQVSLEEKQRVLGIIPNFYVVYDHNPAPMPAKLKFKLALRAETDPVTILGVGFVAGLDQGGGTPDYDEGAEGYGQRVGAIYASGFTDIMFGGAILPVLLHQDPRYFYQGTGSTRSRLMHALSAPFICKGDNGHTQPNFSSVGGDLIAGAMSNAYYPDSNRGAKLVFLNAGITTGGRMVNAVVQEFVLRHFTPGAKNRAE